MERTGERGYLLHRLVFGLSFLEETLLFPNPHVHPTLLLARDFNGPSSAWAWIKLGSTQLKSNHDLRRSISPEPVAVPALGSHGGMYGAGRALATRNQGSHCCVTPSKCRQCHAITPVLTPVWVC